MGIEKQYRDRAFSKDDLLEGVNRELLPIARLVRDRVNASLAAPYVVSSSSGVLDLNWSTHRHYQVTLTEDITSVVFTNSADYGADFFVRFIQGSGAYAVTGWPSTVHWVGGVEPTISATSGRSDMFILFYDGSEYWTEVSQNYV
jgi:hypothetical protein